MDTQGTFGEWMKQRRKQLDLTQEELAGLVACSSVTIKKIESDQRRPSKQVAVALAKALQITPTEIDKFLADARGITSQEPVSTPLVQTHLPLLGKSIVKRPAEIAVVCELLRRPDLRLLTLTGPGGVGKTQLATQAAQEIIFEFPDGVYLIDLATLSRPELLMTSIAVTVGLTAPDERTAQQALSGYFQGKQALVVLDNFEQILDAAPALAAWIRTVTGPKILVTSRARLRLSMEVEYIVPTMDVPALDNLPTLNELLLRYPAVELFILRVQAVQPEFQLTLQKAQDVVEICTLLDGLPLAIELAAARCNLLDPAALLERLKHFRPLRLLTGGPQDQPPRQQTLQQAIDWSYSLLNDDERLLFERLSIFAGGATLQAIESICAGVNTLQMLDHLQTLINHSLIWRSTTSSEDAPPRFQMLVTLREYALERLTERGELNQYRHQHALYFEQLMIDSIPGLRNAHQSVTSKRLEVELDNFRIAMEWCCSPAGDLELGMRMAGRLWEFWLMHGEIEEGQGWILRLLGIFGDAEPTIWKAHLLNGLGMFAMETTEYQREYFDESLVIFRKLGDPYGEAWVLNHLSQLLLVGETQTAYPECRSYLTESLRLFETLNAQWNIAWVLHNIAGLNFRENNFALTEAYIQQGLRLFQQIGDRRGIAESYNFLAVLAERQENFRTAIKFRIDSIELLRQIMDIHGIALRNINLGELFLARDNITDARACFLESLQLFRQKGNLNLGVARSLIGLSQVERKDRNYEQAVLMLSAAFTLLKQSATHGQDFEHGVYSSLEQALCQHVSVEKYQDLWQEGQKDPFSIIKQIEKEARLENIPKHLTLKKTALSVK